MKNNLSLWAKIYGGPCRLKKNSENFDGSLSVQNRNFPVEFKLICINQAKNFIHWGVLIERAHYYAILAVEGRTFREGVLIEEGALTDGVR